jgi:hypothetical protein
VDCGSVWLREVGMIASGLRERVAERSWDDGKWTAGACG